MSSLRPNSLKADSQRSDLVPAIIPSLNDALVDHTLEDGYVSDMESYCWDKSILDMVMWTESHDHPRFHRLDKID
jgi:hypothetical protein